MKFLLSILILCGCATKSEVRKLEAELKMISSFKERVDDANEKSILFSVKPLPLQSTPPMPPPAEVYIFTNANSRMQADPEWLKTIKGVDYWADRESVRRMNNRREGMELILRGARIIEENR